MKALQDLETSASSDAAVRERIAALPPAVSDVNLLSQITGMSTPHAYSITVFTGFAI